MDRFLLAAGLMALAAGVAYVVQRRQSEPPTQPRSWTVPAQLDRRDFTRPDAPWLVILFSSHTCETCAGLRDKVELLRSDAVAVQEIEAVADREVQQRYAIDAVPTLVIADGEGVVRASFVGPVSAADLWATMADLREPGSVPPGCDHGQHDHGHHEHDSPASP